MKNINCVFDGACGPRNPGGRMGIGVAIFEERNQILQHSGGYIAHPNNTNNIAEWMAMLWLLQTLVEKNLNTENIVIYGDSQLVINQIKGTWKIKAGGYVHIAQEALKVLRSGAFKYIKFEWCPREKNGLADRLSKQGMENPYIQFQQKI